MSAIPASLAEEDVLRANFYGLLAALLGAPPSGDLLARLGALVPDPSDLGIQLGHLADAARHATPDQAEQEYTDLFVGLSRGEVVPFASFYLTGFLNEKPLAVLRGDMAALGIERSGDFHEPEDHMAFLCEMMQGLILGEFGDGQPDWDRRFFDRHLAPWAERFFEDLAQAPSAGLYAPIGRMGRIFMQIEAEAFRMQD